MSSILRTALLAAFALAPAQAMAQVFVEARLGGAFDSLRFTDAEPEQRGALSGFVEVDYRFADEQARLWYSLDAASYATPGDWTTLLHDAGAVYRVDLSSSHRLFVAASASWRTNGDAWAAAGYHALSARANLELRPVAGRTLRLGYRIDGRRFPDLVELNQLEQDGFASALFNFQTRTTLIGEVHLGAKSYEGAAATPVASAPLPAGGSGRGRGPGGMGPTLRPSLSATPDSGETAGRVAWMVRLAQSLADRTGVSLQYDARHAFGNVPPLLITTPPRFEGDGVYDDPYASDARGVRAVLTHELAALGTARAWGSWAGRDYAATPALDPDGEPTGDPREDRTWRVGAGWRLPLFPGRTGDVELDLGIAYDFTARRSNDAFYDYTSHAVGAALSLSY